jgi:hypothetical protein
MCLYTTNSGHMIWYDFAVINLSHLFESLTKMELVQRFDATLGLLVNTGTVNIDVGSIETPDLLQINTSEQIIF